MVARLSRGFTLVEMLVVVAIIMVLAGILFPVFGRAREQGRRSSCVSHLRQIGLAFFQYGQDYDEHELPTGGFATWPRLFQPYIKNVQIFRCPSDPYVNSPDKDGVFRYAPNYRMSYAITVRPDLDFGGVANFGIMGDTPTSGNYRPLLIAEYEVPSETFMIGEFGNDPNQPRHYGTYIAPIGNSWGNNGLDDYKYSIPGARHFDGGNWMFVDGHVKWKRFALTNESKNGLSLYFWRIKKINRNTL